MSFLCIFMILMAMPVGQFKICVTKRLESFFLNRLVPDIVSQPPASLLSVIFPSGVEVDEGNELSIEDAEGYPEVKWNAEDGVYYTIIMCDPDAPSRKDPHARSFLHWLVINAQVDDVSTGHTVVNLINSNPGPGTGLHRYLFLVYEQPGEIKLKDYKPNETFEGRINFSPDDFAAKYKLVGPIAGNFYVTQNDSYKNSILI